MKAMKNIVLSFLCVCLFPAFLSDQTLGFSNSYFSILLWVLLYLLFQYADRQSYHQRMRMLTHGLGFIYSSMTACGYALDRWGSIWCGGIALIVSVLLYTHVFALVLAVLWTYLEKREPLLRRGDDSGKNTRWDMVFTWTFGHPAVIAVILLICWTPCYVSTFPGGFSYDATPEFEQILDGNGYNENFPMLHSVLITRILSFAHRWFQSYNAGIAFYTICQMILIALMFTSILTCFYRKWVNRALLALLLSYCAFFPVIHVLVTHTVRDVMFSSFLTYMIFLFYLYSSEKQSFMRTVKMPFLLGIVFVFTMLARNNNVGTVMLVIIFGVSAVILVENRKENLRGACIFAGSAIGGYLLLSALLLSLCQPRLYPNTQKGALSIFSQCIARSYFVGMESWTEEEEKGLGDYFKMKEFSYVPENADPSKTSIRFDDSKTLADFFGYWCKIGLRRPGCYLDAVLANTKQMWFPGSVIDGYNKAGGYQDYDKCYFYFNAVQKPGTAMNFLPKVGSFYQKICLMISFEKIPIISMLFSIGFQFWMLLNCCFYAVYRQCRHLYLPLAVLLGYALISAFVPLVLLRYFSALFLAFPMTAVFTLQPKTNVAQDS